MKIQRISSGIISLSITIFLEIYAPFLDGMTKLLSIPQSQEVLARLVPILPGLLVYVSSAIIYDNQKKHKENLKLSGTINTSSTKLITLEKSLHECNEKLKFWRNIGKDLLNNRNNYEKLKQKIDKYKKELKNKFK